VHRSGWLDEVAAPPETRAAVADRARRSAINSLQMLALLREVLDAFAEEQVDAVVLKGAPIAFDAYGGLGGRSHGDLDVLVSPEALPRAVRVLRAMGLAWEGVPEPADPDRPPVGPGELDRPLALPLLRDVTLTRGGLRVELHWRLFANPRLMPVDPAWLQEPRRVERDGVTLPALPRAAEWLYVLLHGANHLWSRMKWLADVPVLALRRPDLARRHALQQCGYNRAVAASLIVAETTFGQFLPADSRAWAHCVRGTSRLVRRSMETLGADHDPPKRVSPRELPRYVSGRMALSGDPRYRLEEARLMLLSAGRAQSVERPGMAALVTGPLSWAGRSLRRIRQS
jgi:hypothetical protein